jgi:hypothetical protein
MRGDKKCDQVVSRPGKEWAKTARWAETETLQNYFSIHLTIVREMMDTQVEA